MRYIINFRVFLQLVRLAFHFMAKLTGQANPKGEIIYIYIYLFKTYL